MKDFLPAHTEAEREHLKADIKANGLACMTADEGPRRFIDCDRDEDMYKSARMRIDDHLRMAKEAA